LTEKPEKIEYGNEIIYDNHHWELFKNLRLSAIRIMEKFESGRLFSIAHGSVARGDIDQNSDIDIFIPNSLSSFQIENAMRLAGLKIVSRFIIQATPTYAMKGYIEVDDKITVSFPLMNLRKTEREFYSFGGKVDLIQLRKGIRVNGVDKRLMLIQPTEKGHRESTIIGFEHQTAKILGISTQTVLNRKLTLLKREKVGRTGVFIKKELSSDETFELLLKRLSGNNPAVRRRLRN